MGSISTNTKHLPTVMEMPQILMLTKLPISESPVLKYLWYRYGIAVICRLALKISCDPLTGQEMLQISLFA